jgi:imidazole glycerol-phosphate synthase subunit HisH
MIVIVDAMGNVGSIANMLKKVGAETKVSDDPEVISRATKLILPGVGAFDNGMRNLISLGLVSILGDKVLRDKIPVLGICLGMHLLTRGSEEGELPGLGWLDADTVRFRFDHEHADLKIPHMGWNTVEEVRSSPLFADMPEEPKFYFVHSYHVKCRSEMDILASTSYGYDFPSVIAKENVFGTQFHPEKSHTFGMRVLRNFSEL